MGLSPSRVDWNRSLDTGSVRSRINGRVGPRVDGDDPARRVEAMARLPSSVRLADPKAATPGASGLDEGLVPLPFSFNRETPIMRETLPHLTPGDFPAIRRRRLETLQVNLGYRCNQACLHCHVNAGPNRREVMAPEVIDTVLHVLERSGLGTLDVTGGAPELNPDFRRLVRGARALGCHVIDRCNLTILEEPGQEDLGEFLAAEGVEIVASLPCYQQANVDAQRGDGVFAKSIRALQYLNRLGYGQPAGERILTLVYNPGGASLPPDQEALEAAYRRALWGDYQIAFTRLFTLTNMPIARFGSTLLSRGEFGPYMDELKGAMNPANLETVMCRSLISVDWQGRLYDCDFNQMLDLPLSLGEAGPRYLEDLLRYDLEGNPIAVADHCYGCTAGQGSSCGGALS